MCVLASNTTVTGAQAGASQFTRYHSMTHRTITATAQEYSSTSDCYRGGGDTTYLDLHYNDINRIQLSRWPNLVKLNLESNGLTNLNGLQSCRSLQWIDVGNNDFAGQAIDGINGLTQLIYFSAKKNGITRVALSTLPSLEYFDVSTNDIKTITGLGQCPKLRHLYMSSNFLSNVTTFTTGVTGSCKSLEEVRLKNNNFSKYDNDNISRHYQSFSHVNVYLDSAGGYQV